MRAFHTYMKQRSLILRSARYCERVARDTALELELTLGRFLVRSSRTALYEAILDAAPDCIDQQTYLVLSGVARLGPITAARLSNEIGLDRSGASRYADRLEAAGYLRRRADPTDARATLLDLTPQGQTVIRQLRTALRRRLQAAVSDWPTGRVDDLIDSLNELLNRLA
jgi:DNA-binding MarR family transcriptional regulator